MPININDVYRKVGENQIFPTERFDDAGVTQHNP